VDGKDKKSKDISCEHITAIWRLKKKRDFVWKGKKSRDTCDTQTFSLNVYKYEVILWQNLNLKGMSIVSLLHSLSTSFASTHFITINEYSLRELQKHVVIFLLCEEFFLCLHSDTFATIFSLCTDTKWL
jgi:hypothetical protein